jgi:hypothetical protein
MHERIKLLAEQAGIAVWGDAVYMYHPSETLDSTVVTKFAELIVEECIDIVDNAVTHREPASTYVNKIKQHFGVES